MSLEAVAAGSRTPNLRRSITASSPRNGLMSAPLRTVVGPSPGNTALSHDSRPRTPTFTSSSAATASPVARTSSFTNRRPRAISRDEASLRSWSDLSSSPNSCQAFLSSPTARSPSSHKMLSVTSIAIAKAQSRYAQKANDAMVYLDGPQVYACSECRTHLTSHDDIVSKSFHGRHGRAFLFDQCVNVDIGRPEDRLLMTGMHSVSDIYCRRCKRMVGWTYAKAYQSSQKYKEGKFIIEKINLHLEESDYYQVCHPAGERGDRWRKRAMSWGSEGSLLSDPFSSSGDLVYEYRVKGVASSPR